MKEELEQLIELQNIDDQLGELERSKVYLPDMIKNIENDIQSWKEKYAKSSEELEKLNREKKALELETEVAQSELKKAQEQMKDIKTNKEYDALTAQISSFKEKISGMEEKLLETMDEIDAIQEEKSEAQKKYQEMENNNDEVLKNLNREIDSIEDKMRMKEDQRKNITTRLNRRTLSHYERIRKGKGGMAVVTVRKRSCGGCYKQLPPQMVQEIKKGERLLTCDNCGRILLWDSDESQ